MRILAARAAAFALIACAGCAGIRMRIDAPRLKKIETIAPVTFVGNRFVRSPASGGELPNEPTDATSEMIFESGVPAFFAAVRGADRFKLASAAQVLGSKSYAAFPTALSGTNANGAQLARGWRYVTPEDGVKIGNLLEEIDADAALITYWRFTLDSAIRGDVGAISTATTRAHVRVWLVDRDGKVVADDELDAPSDDAIGLHNGHYDARSTTPLFDDAITTCAIRMIADFSNARSKARGE